MITERSVTIDVLKKDGQRMDVNSSRIDEMTMLDV